MADAPADRPCLHCALSEALDAFFACYGDPPEATGLSALDETLYSLSAVVAERIGRLPTATARIEAARDAHDGLDAALLAEARSGAADAPPTEH